MAKSNPIQKKPQFSIKNIGGIDQTEVTIAPGVTVLTGKNATNRTSFLQSIICAMGSERASLKGDAKEGHVQMEFGNETYQRTIKRTGNSVTFEGEGYFEDSEVADLFAYLLEDNEARQAASQPGELRDVIMRPVDTDAIHAEIRRLEDKKTNIEEEIDRIESQKNKIPKREQQRKEIQGKIETKRKELSELEEEIDKNSHDIEQGRKEQEELETKLQNLRETRSDLESTRQNIERQEDSISSLKREQNKLEKNLDELPEEPMSDISGLESDISSLRTKRQNLNSEINELRSLIQYNEERLEAEDYELLESEERKSQSKDGSLTDQLVESSNGTVVCWTCGSSVESGQIESTIDRLKSLRSDKVKYLNEVKDQLEDLKGKKREATQKKQRRSEINQKLDNIRDELDRRRKQVDTLKQKRETLTDEVGSLESEVEDLESADFEEVLSLHKEANQLEFEIENLESNLEEVSNEIEELEADIERAEDLREEREKQVEELTDKRTKVEQIEGEAIDSFNNHMESILELLNYDNIERIWIERIQKSGRGGSSTEFELHIVRTTENGAAYEDTIDHLSESEREVTGLIFALAGYLVHGLHESVPFIVLDSLETIDSERIATLVDYFAQYADFLVVALLPEDAQALDDEYRRVTSI